MHNELAFLAHRWQGGPVADVLAFPLLSERLPLPVARSLDPVLDAAADCLARHGLTRTSLSDIAREMGVAPSTVYRKVGSVDNAALLVFAREAQRLAERMPTLLTEATGPESVTAVMAECVRTVSEHPVTVKVLRDEGEWLGRLVSRRLPAIIEQAVETAEPFVAAAIAAGLIRRQNASTLTHWLVRLMLVCVVSPPPGDLVDALNALVLPALT
jgi:AcrR family transcriptional regulator